MLLHHIHLEISSIELNKLFCSLYIKTRPLKIKVKTSPHGLLCSLCFNVFCVAANSILVLKHTVQLSSVWILKTVGWSHFQWIRANASSAGRWLWLDCLCSEWLLEWIYSKCLSNPKFNIDTSSVIPLMCLLGLTLKDSKWQSFPLPVRTFNSSNFFSAVDALKGDESVPQPSCWDSICLLMKCRGDFVSTKLHDFASMLRQMLSTWNCHLFVPNILQTCILYSLFFVTCFFLF